MTPMLRQYSEIKKQYPGTLLFFRLGDFYELFNEDAVIGARELDITLTARHKESVNPVPMCGVPHHSAAGYIARLVKKGYRVAICEQSEAANPTTKLVRREVVRVITPGTAVDPQLTEISESIYLAAIYGSNEQFGVAFLELSTGEFFATEFRGQKAWEQARAEIENYAPREILFPVSLKSLLEDSFTHPTNLNTSPNIVSIAPPDSNKFSTVLTALDDWLFQTDDCRRLLSEHFKVRDLTVFEIQDKTEVVCSAGAVLRYARDTQKALAQHITEIHFYQVNHFLILDRVTLKNLEICESRDRDSNSRRTLLQVIDYTVTGMGSRLLRSWLVRPLIERSEIQTRLNAVEELMDPILREQLRTLLKEISDLERLIGRLNLGTASARDLLAINRSLSQTPIIAQTLSDASSLLLQVLSENIFELPEIRDLISRSIADDPPANFSDGGVIRENFSIELDQFRSLSRDAKQIIAGFEREERERTGISNLRIKFNNVFGYFIEISKGNVSRVPREYERRQTLTNAERYTTPQLKEWESKVLGAEEKISELETRLFGEIRQAVQLETKNLQATARALSTLDCLQSLAETAARRNYVAPLIHDGDEMQIIQGRHPIVEAFQSEPFIPNDLLMNNSTDRLLVITGPNMGGKSTILRQTALIQILAQIGSFVPAESARLPIVDRIWTRVGASDDLSSGRSTFMVEMTETASILHNATPRSLILLDEIGRGTSTFDGLSIAWSVAEYLHDSPNHSAKTLFATHYHELTELAEKLSGAKNYQITAIERNGEVIFLHRLAPGKASKSYGIAVARLAGLPIETIERAREVLERLEKYELAVFKENSTLSFEDNNHASLNSAVKRSATGKLAAQFSLFSLANDNVIEKLRLLKLSELSAEQAHSALRQLQKEIV